MESHLHAFFTAQKPLFSTKIVADFVEKYMAHFQTGKTEGLHKWMQTRLQMLFLTTPSRDVLENLLSYAKKDIEQALATDPSLGVEGAKVVIGHYPGFKAITIQRLSHIFYEKNPEFARALTEWVHSQTGIDIHPGATIGEYFFIDHGTGIVIGETAEIGHHVVLYHGVTLGNRSRPNPKQNGKKRHPTVGNGVTIFANATVLGGDTVLGDDVKIGAGAMVLASVPDGSKVPSMRVFEGKE